MPWRYRRPLRRLVLAARVSRQSGFRNLMRKGMRCREHGLALLSPSTVDMLTLATAEPCPTCKPTAMAVFAQGPYVLRNEKPQPRGDAG